MHGSTRAHLTPGRQAGGQAGYAWHRSSAAPAPGPPGQPCNRAGIAAVEAAMMGAMAAGCKAA